MDSESDSDPGNVYYGRHGVSWVLRFGGACALVRYFDFITSSDTRTDTRQIGAAFSRAVAPTRTEKEMRRRLAEMKELEVGEGTA